ncbi:Polyphenol oxidase 1, partial [Madurella mycetomatis]
GTDDVTTPVDSHVVRRSDTSRSGEWRVVDNTGHVILPIGATEPVVLPPRHRRRLRLRGPRFANFTVRLGPITQPDPTANNPRCLKRDLNADAAKRFTTFRNTTELILQSPTIEFFRTTMEGDPRYVNGSIGVHGGGHFTIAGDPGSDPFISPGDPAFYLHHAQIDRVYWIWQMLDFENRQGVFGTNTIMDFPPSENTTVEDNVDLSPLRGPVKIKDLMNTVGGNHLCYVYL